MQTIEPETLSKLAHEAVIVGSIAKGVAMILQNAEEWDARVEALAGSLREASRSAFEVADALSNMRLDVERAAPRRTVDAVRANGTEPGTGA